jgi:hypothetical protein
LQTVYKSFDRAQRQNALAAEITADKHERAQSDMVKLMEKLINDNSNTQAVMRSLLTNAPQLALAVASDTVLNLAEASPTDQGDAPGGDGAEAMAAVSTLTEQLESTAKRGRNDEEAERCAQRGCQRVGRLAQEEYKNDNPAPDLAFEAFMEHFMEEYDEVESPDGGGAFDLSKLLTYELFNDQLLRYARYKSVGAKVGGAVSSLELIRRLSGKERRAYFDVAKQCIVGKKTPGHWAEMVFVLLKKKHGDQRKIRKMREIALMDQTLKLMLKCVKKLSYDRCVGRTGEENHGWVPGHGALNAALT